MTDGMIHGRNCVGYDMRTYKNNKQIATKQGNGYKSSSLSDYPYFNRYK